MSVFAAVMTGKGVGAISTIQVFGGKAEAVIEKIFKPAGNKPTKFKTGEIILGDIVNGAETIDQVLIGCEGRNSFAVNCHGNPLIVEMIMELLGQNGVELLTAEQLLVKILGEQKELNTIAIEAKLAQSKAKTLEGTKLIANQITGGLSETAGGWLENINALYLDEIKNQAEQILKNSVQAKLIIGGCRVVLVGPANTGKSTLLNYLAGKQKAIVTDIKGTTRDWVSTQCLFDMLCAELIDTAGLDLSLLGEIEKRAQQKALEILQQADLVLLVLDSSESAEQLDDGLFEKLADKKILTVLNKSDLPVKLDADELPKALLEKIEISAKSGTGIEGMIKKIQQLLGVGGFDLNQPICVTDRQRKLVRQLAGVKSKEKAAAVITELLNGRFCV